jgi:hypothetical protein
MHQYPNRLREQEPASPSLRLTRLGSEADIRTRFVEIGICGVKMVSACHRINRGIFWLLRKVTWEIFQVRTAVALSAETVPSM